MMSSDKLPTKPANSDNQSTGSRKTGSPRPPEPNLKCPRCDSPNTKFCYYNNYNLSQPRHFCKTCRRYWTRGGALRNVPVGGGCRKNKKIKSGSRLSDDSKDMGVGGSIFYGMSPAMEFQYGGARLPFSRLNSPSSSNVYNHLFSFGDLSSSATSSASLGAAGTGTSPCFDIDVNGNGTPSSTSLMGFSLPVRQADQSGGFNWGLHDNLAMNVHSNLASSIESLSSINQDLHWKLQQQRLATLYVGENHKDSNTNTNSNITNTISSMADSFPNLDISRPDSSAVIDINSSATNGNGNGNSTEWLFENSYAPASSTANTNSSWNRVQVWSDLNQYSGLPQ